MSSGCNIKAMKQNERPESTSSGKEALRIMSPIPSIHQPIHPSVCPSVHLSIRPSVRPSITIHHHSSITTI